MRKGNKGLLPVLPLRPYTAILPKSGVRGALGLKVLKRHKGDLAKRDNY